MKRAHADEYTAEATARCERVLLTFLGDVGEWRERVTLVGGLVPRFLVGTPQKQMPVHVGTTDVDLAISIALSEDSAEAYRTLENHLRNSGFTPEESFCWARDVDGRPVKLEFLCETDRVAPGRIFKPVKAGEATGSNLGAFNVPGANLVILDFAEHELKGLRLEGGGESVVKVRVAGLLSFVVLKILAFQNRHNNKDAYDLVYCLMHWKDGPEAAGAHCARSPVAAEPIVSDALRLLTERFAQPENDGPQAYGQFLATPGDDDERMRLARDASAAVLRFVESFEAGMGERTQ